jgi:hypothetical protein
MKGASSLPDEDLAALFRAITAYVSDEGLPDMGPAAAAVFEIFRVEIDEDTDRYNEVCAKRKSAGSKGGQAKSKAKQIKQNEANQANGSKSSKAKQIKQNEANQADRIGLDRIGTEEPQNRETVRPLRAREPEPPEPSPEEAQILAVLEAAPGYPYSPETDLAFIREKRKKYPGVDLLFEAGRYRAHYTKRPFAADEKPRSRLASWIRIAYESLRQQEIRDAAAPAVPEPPWPYSVTYEQIAGMWDSLMLGEKFSKAPETVRRWKDLLRERIGENPAHRDDMAWWRNVFREIYESDFASGRIPGRDGNIWRLELSALLESEDRMQKLLTGKYRNREAYQEGPRFRPYEGPDSDYDPGVWDREEAG